MSLTTGAAVPAKVRPPRPKRKRALWRDPAGRFSWLKLITLVLVLAPGVDAAVFFALGALGSRPLTEAIHRTGDWTVRFILIALAVTPARVVFDWARAVYLRRMLGVTAALYALTHLLLYCADQKWALLTVATEIFKRIYLTIGFAALLGLQALAITSTDAAIRRMGRWWNRLHRLIYGIAVLALLHFFMQSKADVSDAVFVAGLYLWLMLWRATPRRIAGTLWVLPPIAILAGSLTVGVEALWYALATRVDVSRVVEANLDLTFGPRPAVAVAIVGLIVFVVAAARRIVRRVGRRRAAPLPAVAARPAS